MEYASPIWSLSISPTSWYKLQKVQISALRVSTGCYLTAKPGHLNQLTKVLPLQEHCKLIAQQYLAACFLPGHPGRKHLDRPPVHRPERGETILTYKPITCYLLLVVVDASAPVGAVEGECLGVSIGSSCNLDCPTLL